MMSSYIVMPFVDHYEVKKEELKRKSFKRDQEKSMHSGRGAHTEREKEREREREKM